MQLALFLVALAALGAFIAVIALLSSIIQQWERDKQGQPPDEQASAEEESNESGQRYGDRIIGSGALPTDAVAQAIHTYRYERSAHERRRGKTDQVNVMILSATALFAMLAFLASAVADIFFYAQLGEMRDEQRPWVSFGVVPTIKSGTPLKFSVQWGNVGHSPALRFTTQYIRTIVKKGDKPPAPLSQFQPLPSNEVRSFGVLLPNQQSSRASADPTPLTDGDIQAIRDGRFSIWIVGRSEYSDVYGASYYTMFRAVYDAAEGSLLFTEEGNDAK